MDRLACFSTLRWQARVFAAAVQVLPGGCSVHTPIGVWMRDGDMHQLLKELAAFDQVWLGNSLRR